MSNPFIGEIRIMGFGFAPVDWAFCNGGILPIAQNTALFSILGTIYGGDGKTTFQLPNLQGRAPMHPGQGPGTSLYTLGEQSGEPQVALLAEQMPAHSHAVTADLSDGAVNNPNAGILAEGLTPGGRGGSTIPRALYTGAAANHLMDMRTIGVAGGSVPHENRQPYLGLNFCIALNGIFPPRS